MAVFWKSLCMKSSPLWKSSLKPCREKGKWQKRRRLGNSASSPSGFLVFLTHPTIQLPFPNQFGYLVRQEVPTFPLSQICPWRLSRGWGFGRCPGDAPNQPRRRSGIPPLLRARRSPASRALCMGKSFIFLSLPRHVLSLNFYVCNPSWQIWSAAW